MNFVFVTLIIFLLILVLAFISSHVENKFVKGIIYYILIMLGIAFFFALIGLLCTL